MSTSTISRLLMLTILKSEETLVWLSWGWVRSAAWAQFLVDQDDAGYPVGCTRLYHGRCSDHKAEPVSLCHVLLHIFKVSGCMPNVTQDDTGLPCHRVLVMAHVFIISMARGLLHIPFHRPSQLMSLIPSFAKWWLGQPRKIHNRYIHVYVIIDLLFLSLPSANSGNIQRREMGSTMFLHALGYSLIVQYLDTAWDTPKSSSRNQLLQGWWHSALGFT